MPDKLGLTDPVELARVNANGVHRVSASKGGARDRDILTKLDYKYDDTEEWADDAAALHAELLFIHPFREGNGRTARLLADLMAQKAGFPPINRRYFNANFDAYVKAVQQAANLKYELMQAFFRAARA